MAKELTINGNRLRVQAADVACDITVDGTPTTNLQDALDMLVADANGDAPPNPVYADMLKTAVINDSAIGLPLDDVVYNAVIGGLEVSNARMAIERLKSYHRVDVGIIRVLSWNIGHFAMGNSASGYVSPSLPDRGYGDFTEGEAYTPNGNEAVQRQRWNARLGAISPDVFLVSEYHTTFSSVDTHDTLFGAFLPYYIDGTNQGYSHNALYTRRFPFYWHDGVLKEEVNLGSARYLLKGMVKIGSTDVVIACLHTTPGSSAERLAQFDTVISDLSQYNHIILGGDFNVAEPEEYEKFQTAGFTMANQINDPLMTWPATGWQQQWNSTPAVPYCSFDNIMVKGFAMGNVTVIDDSTLTDHCGIFCDLTLL